MKRFWKNVFTLGAIAGVGYIGFKGYQRISNISKMSKTLPDYLEDLLDEKPKININMGFNSLSIAVGLSAVTFENIDFDLDDQIKRYIIDYYPCLSKLKIFISKYIKSSIEEEEEYEWDEEIYDKDVEQCETYYDDEEDIEEDEE